MRIASTCVAAAMLVTVAACGGSGTPSASSSSYVPAMSDDDLLALGKQVTQCMRDNGVADMPDPFIEDHRLKVPEDEMDAVEEKAGEQVWKAARQACQELFDKVPQGAIADGNPQEAPRPGPEDVETLRKFAECVRQNGVPEWPDPDSEGRFPITGTSLEGVKPEPGTPLHDAHQACRGIWSGSIGIS